MGCAVASEFAAHNKIAFVVLVSPFNKARDEVKYYIDKTNMIKDLLNSKSKSNFVYTSTPFWQKFKYGYVKDIL